MECKNCGHDIIINNKEYFHIIYTKYTNQTGSMLIPQAYRNKCKCGCTKPEPKDIIPTLLTKT